MEDIQFYKDKRYVLKCNSKEEWDAMIELVGYPERYKNYYKSSKDGCLSLYSSAGIYWSSSNLESILRDGYAILYASDFLTYSIY